ncbi:MAG: hypothetical protein PVI30_21875 [Myxococcales bacterium]|jgi:hypothetical protein
MLRFVHRSLVPVLLSSACCVALPARAQEPPQEPADGEPAAADAPPAGPSEQALEEARQAFAEGLTLAERGEWLAAEERFRHVLEVRSSPVVSYNLASALVQLGRLVEASDLLRGIVRDDTADRPTRTAAQQMLETVEPRIGTLTVRLGGDIRGAQLLLDERPYEGSGIVQAISVDPGEHEIVVRRDGEALARKQVRVGGGAPLHVEVALSLPRRANLRVSGLPGQESGGVSHTGTLPGEAADDGSIWTRWWLWAGAGAVVAAGVVTAVVLASGGEADPVRGDTDPPVVRGRVQGLAR